MHENKKSKEKYILSYEKMFPADVILTRENSLTSTLITSATQGQYSHAALYLGGGSYIEATKEGVHTRNIQRLLLKDPTQIKIMRSNNILNKDTLYKICNYARLEYGKEYSIEGALNSVLPTNYDIITKQFCSRLVATCYEKSGHPICSNISKCTPETINKSPIFIEVKDIVREATDQEIIFANDKSKDKTEIQKECVNIFLNKLRKSTKADLPTLNDVVNFVIDNPQYDVYFTETLKESGYL